MKKLERVKAFFRFATENEWIGVNPARLLRGPANIRDTQKLPFEPAEIGKIFKACREVQIQGCANDELLAFTLVLRYSGLRIGDASMLTVDRFKGDDLYLYTQKSGTHVFVPLPPFVMNLVRAIDAFKHGEYLFTGPGSLRMGDSQRSLAPQTGDGLQRLPRFRAAIRTGSGTHSLWSC